MIAYPRASSPSRRESHGQQVMVNITAEVVHLDHTSMRGSSRSQECTTPAATDQPSTPQKGGGEQQEASNIEGPALPQKSPTMGNLSPLVILCRAEGLLNCEGPATPRNSVEYHRKPAGDVSSGPEEVHGTWLVASDDAASEDDSAHGEDLDNSTESLASSILKYKKVNDRHYPNEKYEGGYW